MAEATTTIDALVASARQSFIAANELILGTARNAAASRAADAEADDELHRQARFIVNNTLGKQPGAIPLALFFSDTTYHLSDLRLDLPCYTVSGLRLFGRWKRGTETVELYAFTPAPWQRLFYVCHLYHLVVMVGFGQVEVVLRSAFEEEAIRLIEKRAKRRPPHTAWKFRLTPEQQNHLLALPRTVARPVYWRSAFRRLWERLKGKPKEIRQGE